MRITPATRNSRPLHTEAVIWGFDYVLLRNWGPEARPAGTGLEFRVGIEKSCVAADAPEYALVVNTQKFSGEGPLRSCMTRHFKRIGG